MITLRAWGAVWIEQRVAEGMRGGAGVRSVWRCHIEPADFIDLPISEITRPMVRAWLAGVRSTRRRRSRFGVGRVHQIVELPMPISPATATRALQILRACLNRAVDDGALEHNPAARVGSSSASSAQGWTYLTMPELELALRSPIIPERERLLYAVAVYTGLRKGELWGLLREDVRLEGDRPQITVRRSYDGPTKSGRIGHVPLLRPARDALRRYLALAPESRLVFPTTRGTMRGPHDTARWADYWARGVRQPGWRSLVGITRRVRFHDFRHTCASHLIMGSWGRAWSLVEVRDMLRHHSVTETERYAHLSPESLHAAASKTRGLPPAVTQRSSARRARSAR